MAAVGSLKVKRESGWWSFMLVMLLQLVFLKRDISERRLRNAANTANAEAVFVAIAVFAAAEKGSAAATFAAK